MSGPLPLDGCAGCVGCTEAIRRLCRLAELISGGAMASATAAYILRISCRLHSQPFRMKCRWIDGLHQGRRVVLLVFVAPRAQAPANGPKEQRLWL